MKIQRIKQRSIAINAFLTDVYHKAEIIKANLIPGELIYKNPAYDIKMVSFNVQKIYTVL